MTDKKHMTNMFNVDKKDYKSKKLLFGEEMGLFDTINRPFPEIWDLYKQAIAQNWSEDEFDFSPCAKEFARMDDAAEMMIETIAWQMEADSAVSHTLMPILAPFITNSELCAAMAFNTYIECVHSATYSEIVRNSFDNPNEVMDDILENKESIERLSKAGEVMQEMHDAAHRYALGEMTKEEAFPIVYLGVTALYLLERLQFVSSFAITFALGEAGMYQPIANAVRKICADEIEIHASVDAIILREMRKDELFKKLCDNDEFQQKVIDLIDSVVECEMTWTDHLFKGRTLVGVNCQLIKDWVMFNGQNSKSELELPYEEVVKENPIPWINNWLTMNKLQTAPQEMEIASYLIGGIDDDTDDVEFEL